MHTGMSTYSMDTIVPLFKSENIRGGLCRALTYAHPGKTLGFVGCVENKLSVKAVTRYGRMSLPRLL